MKEIIRSNLLIKKLLTAYTALSVFWIFRIPAADAASSVLLPVISRIPDNSWQVSILSVLLIIVWYAYYWKRIINERDYLPDRLICVVVLFLAFLMVKDEFYWYGLNALKCSYVSLSFMIVGLLETSAIIRKICRRSYNPTVSCLSFQADSPAENDEYNREAWIENLVEKMLATYSAGQLEKNSFTILISDCYGAGKTTALNMMQRVIASKTDNKVSVLEFKPWLSENTEGMTKNFFEMLAHELRADKHIRKMLKKYSDGLTNDSRGILYDILSYMLTDTTDSLENQHSQISDILRYHGLPIIILVDDVDRLQQDEFMQLLKLIRDAADFPNIFYVVAADKVAIHSSLLSAGIPDPEFYLRKFFNLEIMFPAEDDVNSRIIGDKMRGIIAQYQLSEKQLGCNDVEEFIKQTASIRYVDEIFRNSRDLVRFFNMLTLSMDLMKKEETLDDVCFMDLIRITIIQMLDSETYRMLRDHGYYILEDVGNRYVLNETARKGIYDKIESRRITETFKGIARINKNGTNTETDDKEAIYPSNLKDTLAFCRPSKEDIISSLLSEMFPSSISHNRLNSICYIPEYFKYFAGIYKRTQISDLEISELLDMHENNFRFAYKDILKNRNISFIHKWKSYVRLNSCDRIKMLKKLMIAVEEFSAIPIYIGSGWEIEDKSAEYFREIVWELYKKRDGDNYETEKSKHCEFFHDEDSLLRLQAVVLKLFITPFVDRNDSIFNRKDIMEFAEILSGRAQFLLKNTDDPFSNDTIFVIRSMNALNISHWQDAFKSYLKSVKDPESWFYRLVTPYTNSFDWNHSYLYSLGIEHEPNEISINDFIKNLPLGEELSDEISDLLKLSSYTSQYLIHQGHDTKHEFLKHALKWHNDNKYKSLPGLNFM